MPSTYFLFSLLLACVVTSVIIGCLSCERKESPCRIVGDFNCCRMFCRGDEWVEVFYVSIYTSWPNKPWSALCSSLPYPTTELTYWDKTYTISQVGPKQCIFTKFHQNQLSGSWDLSGRRSRQRIFKYMNINIYMWLNKQVNSISVAKTHERSNCIKPRIFFFQ